ncbi:RNA polymerase sigma factor [Natribacillus halophilus]|uniref:RNA polymerase sigma-70 factor, ECF subfamily n=1 Tax=Natribacillus halophilus TaxID=549003 RepID=A0A1G8KWR7_9BACI|nr:sigma-70 family RNA polymerase sigma factor [Natribacillus halophilus]SDI47826.1 RNA polymerase sigma-70 factor, ECF subfamily [Natribacillus halophilus]
MASEEPSEQQLIEQIVNKDPQALEQLYHRYERPIYAFAYRLVGEEMMAEEVMQELFLRVWNSAYRYDSDKAKFSTWMFTLTRNISIDLIRKKGRRVSDHPVEDQTLQTVKDTSQNVEEHMEDQMLADDIKEALQALNGQQQDIVEWIYFQGYTQQEVADTYAIPLGTVKSRARLALKNLQKHMAPNQKEGRGRA